MKLCQKCNQVLPYEAFVKNRSKSDGLHSYCKQCQKQYVAVWRAKNPLRNEDIQSKQNSRRRGTRQHYSKEYRERNYAKVLDTERRYRETSKEKRRLYKRKKYRTDPKHRLNQLISRRLRKSFEQRRIDFRGVISKESGIEETLGYSVAVLMSHLETLFQEGMTWDNYGAWHVDHIKPVASYSYTTTDDPEFKKCWALDNLQPLWAIDNLRKGAKESI